MRTMYLNLVSRAREDTEHRHCIAGESEHSYDRSNASESAVTSA